jgi:hypothetical protein
MTANFDLKEGVFYDLVLEYRELEEKAYLKLEWESPSIQRQVIPPTRLFYS